MTFNDIILEIKGGLIGEREHDVSYLQEKCRKYRGHESAQQILRACGRLVCLVNCGCFSQEV